jgi:hypothetical protein
VAARRFPPPWNTLMRIWEHTFEELTGGRPPSGDQDVPFEPQPFIRVAVVPITHNPRFATAPIPGFPSFGNQALLELKNGQWTCVGHYVEDTILLDESVRGRGLAEELLLRCAEHRTDLPLSSNFTNKGYSLLKRAHRLAIMRALKARLPVNQAVLAEYVSEKQLQNTVEIARFRTTIATLIAEKRPIKIYCGCGTVPRPGFLNLDIAVLAPSFALTHPDEYFIFPFADMPWGIPDDCVDYIFHEDFIEHITQLQQIQFLAEALRVLKPGCYHRVNTPNIITAMKTYSNFKDGFRGVYTGELQWGHVSIFSPTSLKEIAELIGYREVIFTTKNHGVSPFAGHDCRPGADRDDIVGNIYADLQK